MSDLEIVRTGPIRYANAARFERPRVVIDDAATSGQICPQLPGRLAPVMGTPSTSHSQGEDCLNLCVTTPGRDDMRRPVMVFLHGGAFQSGGGLLDWYDGGALSAEADVVVVSINYRLGVFGFLCLDGVSDANLGIYDQIEALRWVRDHIAELGGDPANVTVFGQSSGAVSIRLLMEIASAEGLFHRAILQSGPGPEPARPIAAAREIGRLFAEKLGEDPRIASVAALLAAQRDTAAALVHAGDVAVPVFYPTVGDELLPSLGNFVGNVKGMDIICGWNADDTSAFTGTRPGPETTALTDRTLAEPISKFIHQLVEAGAKAYTYRLDWRPANAFFGATHCVELPLLLGSRQAWQATPMLGDVSWEDIDTLGRRLRAVWGQFARTGDIDVAASQGFPITWTPANSSNA